MAFDDLLGPREKKVKSASPEEDIEIELEFDELDLNDILGDDEADDNDGNTLGDPWANIPIPDPCDCEDDECDCDGQCEGC